MEKSCDRRTFFKGCKQFLPKQLDRCTYQVDRCYHPHTGKGQIPVSKPGSAVDFRPEALPDIVVIMNQVNAKGRTCNPIDQACASSRCNPQIQKCKKQKNRRSCHQNRAIDIKHTIPPHQIVQKADRAKGRGQQCLDHKPADGNQTVAGGETEDSIADSTHDSKIDNSKTDDTHNTNNNTGGNTHITDNDRISDNNGGIISDNSNTENTDSNANDSKSETTSSKNETEDPIEFDEKDPVYPEIYVQDERLFDMTLKGRAFAFPAKYSDVADMGLWAAGLSGYSESVDPKNYVIAEDDMETFFSNGATGYSGSMTIDNNTYEEAEASDCDVMGLFLDNCPEFSIGGIKTGSTIEEVNKTFGVNYTNECRTLTVHSQNGAFTDSKGTFTLTVVFAFDDGVVYSVGESKIYSTFF